MDDRGPSLPSTTPGKWDPGRSEGEPENAYEVLDRRSAIRRASSSRCEGSSSSRRSSASQRASSLAYSRPISDGRHGYSPQPDPIERRAMRAVLKVLVCLLVLALGPDPALAVAPERHVLQFDEAFISVDFCGFPTRFEWVGVGYGTVFFNHDGDPIRQIDRIRETLTVTNTTTGASVRGRDAYQLIGVAETLSRVGVWFHLSAPGRGVILRDVGRIVVSGDELTFLAGTHQWLRGDVDALCGALAVDPISR
jgi:hypothetical protein